MKIKSALAALIALSFLLIPTSAQASVAGYGKETVEVGWPGSYFLSRTEGEFRSKGCPAPANLQTRNWDAAIVDLNPGALLQIETNETSVAMNISYYDEDCDPQPGGSFWIGVNSSYQKHVPDDAEWAVISFNYGYKIDFDWRVCGTDDC